MVVVKNPPARRDDSRDTASGVAASLDLCQRALDRTTAVGFEQSQAIEKALVAITEAKVQVQIYIQSGNS